MAHDERCKILISSLQDTLHGVETKSYNSGDRSRRSRSRDRDTRAHHRAPRRRERSASRYRDRSRDREDRDRWVTITFSKPVYTIEFIASGHLCKARLGTRYLTQAACNVYRFPFHSTHALTPLCKGLLAWRNFTRGKLTSGAGSLLFRANRVTKAGAPIFDIGVFRHKVHGTRTPKQCYVRISCILHSLLRMYDVTLLQFVKCYGHLCKSALSLTPRYTFHPPFVPICVHVLTFHL